MDAVILAGGKGSRLDGVMPPYWKPLMPINGLPLICKIYDQVADQGVIDNIFIVVAPENALQVAQVMNGRNAYLVVQQRATGPGDALLLGLQLTKAETVLVLMGDNIMPDDDLVNVVDGSRDTDFVIGTGTVLTADEARRFTRIYEDGFRIEEGPDVSPPDFRDGPYTVWCGPLVLPVEKTIAALRATPGLDAPLGERKIGTHLHAIGQEPMLVNCAAVDIGTPEAIMEVDQHA